jgi:hypothetical protein
VTEADLAEAADWTRGEHPDARRHILALVAEVRRLRAALATFVQPTWRDGRYVAIAIQDQWAAAVAAAEKALS